MPEAEMLAMLAMDGDAVDEWRPGEMISKKGVRYVRSQEGQTYYNGRWEPKYIWCRV